MSAMDQDAPAGEKQARTLTIKEMWAEAEAIFYENTGRQLRGGTTVSLIDCKSQIAKRQLPPDAAAEPEKVKGLQKAKEVGLDVLRCINLLGGVAAQAADMAFPASSLCFSAVSMLLDIPGQLHDFHGAVDSLFERLGIGLSIFGIYEDMKQFDKLEDQLNLAIHRLLISFVKICGLSIKLRNSRKWAKFKVEAKLIFLQKDSGVEEEIKNFEKLISDHSAIQGTQTLKTVLENGDLLAEVLNKASETGQQITAIKDADDKRRSDEKTKMDKKTIREALVLEPNWEKPTADILAKFGAERLEKTVSWIESPGENPDFHRWTNKNDATAKPLFSLTGGINTGKSVIAAAVVYHLRSMYEPAAKKLERTVVGSYFFPNPSGKDSTERKPIHMALRCIAMQIAENENGSFYRTSLAKKCRERPDMKLFLQRATCKQLWDFLSLGDPEGKMSYFLVFDGIGALPDEYRQDAQELVGILNNLKSGTRSVRVLVSLRRPLRSEDHGLRLDPSSSCNLDVEQLSERDVALYVDEVFRKEDIFQDDDKYRLAIRDRIRDRLSQGLGGNYRKAMTALEKIKAIIHAGGKESDIDNVLKYSNESEASLSRGIIRTMEESLSLDQVEEVNELLKWVAYGFCGNIDLQNLEEALFLHFKTHPMVKVKKKLTQNYHHLFEVSGDNVSMAEGMLEVVTKERSEPLGKDDEAKFDLTLTIKKANVTSVQKFLWSLAMKVSQDNFDFQNLEDKTSVKGSIQVNEVDAYMAILKHTFDLLDDDPQEVTLYISRSLLAYLPDHLAALRKAPTVHPITVAEKEIGSRLYPLFSTGDIIKKHWKSCSWISFNRSRDELDMILDWLKNPDLVCRPGTRDHEWLKLGVLASSNPRRSLLSYITQMVAKGLFQDTEWDVGDPYDWIDGVLSDLDLPEDSKIGHLDETEAMIARLKKEHENDDIALVGAYSQEILGVKTPDDRWNGRLAEIYFQHGKFQEATRRFRALCALPSPDARHLENLAQALAVEEETLAEACETMEKALEAMDKSGKETKASTLLQLSRWYHTAKRQSNAFDSLQKALRLVPEGPDGREARYDLLAACFDIEDDETAVNLLSDLDGSTTDQPGDKETSPFRMVIEDMMKKQAWVRFPQFFSVLSSHEALSRRALQELDQTIDRGKKSSEATNELVAALFFKGIAGDLYGMKDTLVPGRTALDYWADCLKVDEAQLEHHGRFFRGLSATFTATHHLDQAVSCLRSSSTVSAGNSTINDEHNNHNHHLDRLVEMAEQGRAADMDASRLLLAQYHILAGHPDLARDQVRQDVEKALDLLSDDEDFNDWEGYSNLGLALMRCGDLLNSLSAYSCLTPPPRKATVLRWMLQFDGGEEADEAVRKVVAELMAKVEGDENARMLGDQIKFVRKALGVEEEEEEEDDEKDEESAAPKEQAKEEGDKEKEAAEKNQEGEGKNGQKEEDKKEEKGQGDDGSHGNSTPAAHAPSSAASLPTDAATGAAHDAKHDNVTQRILARIAEFPRAMSDLAYFTFYCDGCGCGSATGIATPSDNNKTNDTSKNDNLSLWSCRHCHNLQFCSECIPRLRQLDDDDASQSLAADAVTAEAKAAVTAKAARRAFHYKLPAYVLTCRAEHDRMRLPAFDRETYLDTLRGRVRVGGELDVDGRRVGGESVPIGEWLAGLKAEWGYVDKVKTPAEEEKEEDGEEEEKTVAAAAAAVLVDATVEVPAAVVGGDEKTVVEAVVRAAIDVEIEPVAG